MKTINVTFSIPENLNRRLHFFVEKRGFSKFVGKAIEVALEEGKNDLKAAYKAAENDVDLKNAIDEWAIDGVDWNA
jgi:hypothetical protein